jgi:hypothetical protein
MNTCLYWQVLYDAICVALNGLNSRFDGDFCKCSGSLLSLNQIYRMGYDGIKLLTFGQAAATASANFMERSSTSGMAMVTPRAS